MKFHFSFEKLRQYRKLRKDLRARELAQAQSELELERETLREYYQSIKNSRDRICRLVERTNVSIEDSDEPVVDRVQQGESFIEGQMIRISRQRDVIRDKINFVEQKQEALRQSAIEHKILDVLRENRLEAFKKEEQKNEAKEIDDLVVTRYNVR